MAEVIKTDQACPCGSSDAFALYADGSGYCFSAKCSKKHYTAGELSVIAMPEQRETRPTKALSNVPQDGKYIPYQDKNISPATLKDFGVTSYESKGIVTHVKYPAYKGQDIVAAVIKDIQAKDNKQPKSFKWTGEPKEVDTLFGQHLFPKGGKYITITEGQDDAMAGYQMFGSRYPFVSIIKGVGSADKELKENYEYLNSFEHIVICFDNDKPGRKMALECAKIFPGKSKIVNLTKYKDASDYLKNGDVKEFTSSWWSAPTYHPTGVVFGKEAILEVAKRKPEPGLPLVWPGLNDITLGIRKKELWTFGAGTGMGKSEVFKELMYNLMVREGAKVGGIFLEEPAEHTIRCLLSKGIGWRYYLANERDADTQSLEKAAEAIGNSLVLSDNCVSDWSVVKERIEYFVRGLGCEYIFLDHITAIAEGKEQGVNSYIHLIMEELNDMLAVDDFSIFLISHLNQNSQTPHEEGGRVRLNNFYGSGAIKQRSNFVFGLEGNQQSDVEEERHDRILRCLKDRQSGTGVGRKVFLRYSHTSGRLEEYHDGTSLDYDDILKDITDI